MRVQYGIIKSCTSPPFHSYLPCPLKHVIFTLFATLHPIFWCVVMGGSGIIGIGRGGGFSSTLISLGLEISVLCFPPCDLEDWVCCWVSVIKGQRGVCITSFMVAKVMLFSLVVVNIVTFWGCRCNIQAW